jgi:hypothetical protein
VVLQVLGGLLGASSDRAVLEEDTTVVWKCCWVKAFSLPRQMGSCLAASSTWLASTEPIPTPITRNSPRKAARSSPGGAASAPAPPLVQPGHGWLECER